MGKHTLSVRKAYSLLEKNIYEVFNLDNTKANFHPKLWLIREVNNDNAKDVLMKLIVSSRNMAYSDNIDCIACLTGKVGKVQNKNEKHTRLRTFIEKVLSYSNISDEKAKQVKAGKVGSFTPEKQKVEIEQLENKEVADEVEEIFEEDSEFSNDDEALAAMEFYDSPDEKE